MTPTPAARLLARLLGALLSEGLLTAKPLDGPATAWRLDLAGASYTFQATTSVFDVIDVEPGSVVRAGPGVLGDEEAGAATDPEQLVADAAADLDLPGSTVAGFIAELAATLAADHRLLGSAAPAKDVVTLPHAEIEGHLVGHPLLVANKGRLGFSASDCAAYAPEARRPVRPVWLAVSRRLAEFRSVPSMSEDDLLSGELAAETRARFVSQIRQREAAPEGYLLMPAHPWQVDHVVHQLWSQAVLLDQLIVLGEADDDYRPTQSIRTLVNVSRPERHQVKLPLKILNTSVYRGIPRHCALAAPMTTHWLRGIWDADPVLRESAVLLGEVASVTVHHPQLSGLPGVPYQWDETLGCIWREPVEPALGEGETVWPLALLTHQGPAEDLAVSALADRAACSVSSWLERLVPVVLAPLLHLIHTYGITVNPHGENLMVICDPTGMPGRLVVKDLVDDVCVTSEEVPERGWEPDGRDRVLPRKPWHVLRQYLVDALFLGVWGPLGRLLDEHVPDASSADLWRWTRGVVEGYATSHPGQAERLEATGLLGAEFTRYPLNGYRLRTGYTDLDTRPPVPPAGTMPNPMFRG